MGFEKRKKLIHHTLLHTAAYVAVSVDATCHGLKWKRNDSSGCCKLQVMKIPGLITAASTSVLSWCNLPTYKKKTVPTPTHFYASLGPWNTIAKGSDRRTPWKYCILIQKFVQYINLQGWVIDHHCKPGLHYTAEVAITPSTILIFGPFSLFLLTHHMRSDRHWLLVTQEKERVAGRMRRVKKICGNTLDEYGTRIFLVVHKHTQACTLYIHTHAYTQTDTHPLLSFSSFWIFCSK